VITGLLITQPDPWQVLETIVASAIGLLDVEAAAVVLADPRGGLRVVISSDERMQLVELIRLSCVEGGPSARGIAENTVVRIPDLAVQTGGAAQTGGAGETDQGDQGARDLLEAAAAVGVRGLGVWPLRLDHHAVGALVTVWSDLRAQSPAQDLLGQALADLAVLGLVQERDARRTERLAERSLTALNDRAQLLQAVGILAATLRVNPDTAHELLGAYSGRAHQPALRVAYALTTGELDPHELSPPA
jgi:hypothetical protein